MKLDLHEQIPDPDIIAFMQDLLDQAKEGRLVGVAVAAYWRSQDAGTGYCCSEWDKAGLLGEVTILQSTLTDSVNKQRNNGNP